ncbi:MAG: phage major capsid protein [Mobiluncus sp.]|uniref:phage major capsid protein n=1 Tax=Mobiluncus sp. TaxID=47293 RepID=UPI00258750FC|nr:phage major capsid protein [Mobiluncus sp.]MCI6583460.1 phage major capsid protein [Mobiluncus sp.]
MAEQTKATATSDFSGFLKPEQAQPIFDEAMKTSVVQSLARQIPLGINGVEIPVTTGKPEAHWVAEGKRKPSTSTALGIKTMKPSKLAAVTVVSAEVVRANPGNYVEIYKRQIGEAFAKAFDKAALYGGGPFDSHIAQSTKSVTLGTSANGMYGDIVSGLDLLLKDKKKLNGFVFDTSAETLFLNQVDANKRPIFELNNVTEAPVPVSVGTLIGRSARLADNVEDLASKTVGFGGDWTKCAWGVTSGLNFRVSTEAAVTVNGELVSLFESNMVAILAEAEYGWICADPESFVAFKTAGVGA